MLRHRRFWNSFILCLTATLFCRIQACDENEFECAVSGTCIPMDWTCDGVTDCLGEGTPPGSDEQGCPPQSCASNEYKCADGFCIAIEFVCDGENDCTGGEDEQGCPGTTCSPLEFSCGDNYCVPGNYTCDHMNDCPNNADEQGCTYPTCTDLTCDSGACYSTEQKCNGIPNCRDLTDEFNCSVPLCPNGDFQCTNGDCIPLSVYCDRFNDCGDNSDEPSTCDYPPCNGDQYRCDNDVCILQLWVCDGVDNCGDGSDEMDCHYNNTCEPNQWKCPSTGECIRAKQICDSTPDCPNGEDEATDDKPCSSTLCGVLSCDYECQPTPSGGICYCPEGFQVADDASTCIDVDECQIFGYCEQTCENVVGTYLCQCADGYRRENGFSKHCKANPADGAPRILFSTGSAILAYNPESLQDQIEMVVSEPSFAMGIDYHYKQKKIFWTDRNENKVRSANMDGTNVKDVISLGISDPEQVAVDWIGNNLYIVETSVSRIEVCNFDGTHRTAIISGGLSSPRGLALDPTVGYMFFSDWDYVSPRLERAYMDGRNRVTLVDTQIQWANGITVDFVAKRVYWLDGHFDYVETVDYFGKDRRVILTGSSSIPHPFDITIFERHVYFTDWTKLGVVRADKFQGTDYSVVLETGGDRPYGIIAYHPVRQPQVENPCGDNNGGCDHLCLVSHASDNRGLGYVCKCDFGFELTANGKNCKAIDTFLVLGAYSSIRGVEGNFHSDEAIIPIPAEPNQIFIATSTDALAGYIYFFESYSRTISRKSVNGSGPVEELVNNNLGAVRSLAYDWTAQNLYILDVSFRYIRVFSVKDMTSRTDLVTTGLSSPTCIAIAPYSGFMFWGDAYRPAKIMKANMDGTKAETLVNTQIGNPVSLAVDASARRIYWIDLTFERIESISFYGYSRRTLPTTQTIYNPQALAVMGYYVYWSDSRTRKMYQAHRTNSGRAFTILDGTSGIFTISPYDPTTQDRYKDNQCTDPSWPNAGCQYFCFPADSRTRTCGCPYGFKLAQNAMDCVEDPDKPPPPQCTSVYQFPCDNGRCISKAYVCDGIDQCGDGSDESSDCGTDLTCGPYAFTCANKRCISISWRCDGDDDCEDGSDELSCPTKGPCQDTHFQCDNGNCILTQWVCDSDNDCGDGSDEKDCADATCGPNQFTCPGHRCIPLTQKCNGYQDCNDGADEEDCPDLQCSSRNFKCADGEKCLSQYYICDGLSDCTDGSDEQGCPTALPGQCLHGEEYQCQTTGHCLPISWYCDGRQDCTDGSDEPASCPAITCRPDYFKCDHSRCLPNRWKCDGFDDCNDATDEINCPTLPPTPPPPPCVWNEWECPGTKTCIGIELICNGNSDCPGSTDEGEFCSQNLCGALGCTDVCTNFPTGPACSCPGPGYTLLNDSLTCADIDECADFGCSQVCENTIGSFICKCGEGYALDADNHTCKVASEDRIIIVTSGSRIYKYDLDTNRYSPFIYSSNIIAMDFDWKTQKIFYSDSVRTWISSQFFNGSNRETLFSGGHVLAENIAVDWVGRHFYWCDSGLNTIEAAKLDGSHRTVIFSEDLDQPRGLVLDPRDYIHKMFWTDWGQKPKIESSDMDGLQRTTIVSDRLYWPNGLTIDYPSRTLYFADAKLDFIDACDYNGQNRRQVIGSSFTLLHPHSITLLEDWIYWSDRESGSVSRCNKFGADRGEEIVLSGVGQPRDIHAFHPVSQPTGNNPCELSTSPCSHLCLLSQIRPRYYTCACPVGYKLDDDQVTCVKYQYNFLIVATPGTISGISKDPDETTNNKMIPVTNIVNGMDVEFDTEQGLVYWVDRNDAIQQIKLDGTGRQTFAYGSVLGTPSALSIDWLTGNLYYTNPTGKTIEVIRIEKAEDGRTFGKTIVSNIGNETGVANPVGIAVDPRNGVLYWTDQGGSGVPAKITKCGMDGSYLQNIVTGNLEKIQHISVDIHTHYIYWTEQQHGVIGRAKSDGTERVDLVANLIKPMGISIDGDYVYYSDLTLEVVERVKLSDTGNYQVLRDHIKDVTSVKMYARAPSGTIACSANNGGCEQLCLPVGNNRVCACSTGMKPNSDGGRTCSPYTEFAVISQQTVVRGLDLTGSHSDAMPPMSTIYMNASSVDVVMNKQSVVFATNFPGGSNGGPSGYFNNMIYSYKADGSKLEILVSGGIGNNGVAGVAVDWITSYVYFTNVFFGETYIEVVSLDSKRRMILLKTQNDLPRSIVVNPIKKFLYWSDYGQNPKIERALLDASNRTTLAVTGVVYPRGMSIDYQTHQVYWVDDHTSTIERMEWDGSNRVVIRSGRNIPSPYGISLYQDKMYWVDRNYKKVFMASKDPSNSDDPMVVKDQLEGLQDIVIYADGVQPSDSSNPCINNNGGCEQLCFGTPDNKKKCACSTGTLASDMISCEDSNKFLAYSSSGIISSFTEDSEDHSSPFPTITGVSIPISLTFDAKLKRVYFSTGNKLSYFTWSDQFPRVTDILTTGIRSVEGVDYDWVNERLYFTDFSNKFIGLTHLDGSNTSILVRDLDRPRGIALDPCRKFMYWTDWGTEPKIEKATMAGNLRTTLVGTGLFWPNGISLDLTDDKLYWTDAHPGDEKVERCNLDGTTREIIISSFNHPFDITVLNQYFYWTDWQTNNIYRAEKNTGGQILKMVDGNARMYGIVAYDESRQVECTGIDPCARYNGGCSHICIQAPSGEAECSCPEGYYLANRAKDCILIDDDVNRCNDDQYTCTNGRCLNLRYVCDGYRHCSDGVDESDRVCADHVCLPNYFTCNTMKCIHLYYVCDQDDDCGDGSDEEGCVNPTCAPNYFTCNYGRCLPMSQVCDTRDNCLDGEASDEQDCPPSECRPGYVKCSNSNVCVYNYYVCDGDDDCGDNSDEDPLHCAAKTCRPGQFQCDNKHRCLPSYWYCDGDNDCTDGSDEPDTCGTDAHSCPPGTFTCDNGRCIITDWVCNGYDNCQDGSDEDARHDCYSRTCEPGEFLCDTNPLGYSRCIPSYFVCDGDPDCNDASDELQPGCEQKNCTARQFACRNGICIWNWYFCDHDNDCGDGSDEPVTCEYKPCTSSYQFTCENGKCIYKFYQCDGDDDCGDGSDEDSCDKPEATCAPGQFMCLDGNCISEYLVCNLNDDCEDRSDEEKCNIDECSSIASNQCGQLCVNTLTSYYCACNEGYRLLDDDKACEDIDECNETPYVCSQLCENLPGSYLCKCANGYLREPDGKTCKQNSGIAPYLFFSNRYYIRKISVDGRNYELVQQGLDNIVALDYDYRDERLFWTDVTRGRIESMKFDGTDRKILFNREIPDGEGLAVEWITKKLYWVDANLDKMFVSELNGTSKYTLAKGCIDDNNTYCFDQPRAVAVTPKHGYVYWSDWGLSAYIARVGLNGFQPELIITEKISWPNALVIDYVTDRLYWGDAHLDYIEYSNMTGGQRFRVNLAPHTPPHPFAITIFDGYIYWTDWNTLALYKANALDGSDFTMLVNTTHRPFDVHVVHPYRQDYSTPNPCSVNNGGCSHLCLMHPGGARSCVCPDNFISINIGFNHRCLPMCTSAQFRCESNDQCIPFYWKCDGVSDCSDASDEPDVCPVRVCDPGQFQCDNFHCIPPSYFCDHDDDCGDGSDEENCDVYSCLPSQFKCDSSKCISNSLICDGNDDCGDGSDEETEFCLLHTCEPGNFNCDNGHCIPKAWQCDVDDDCGDGSDEDFDYCTGPDHRCDEHTEFACRNNYRCIPSWARCNGADNCRDNSDEQNCPEITCHPDDFRCTNHVCIPMQWKCDNWDDCGDNSDEQGCVPRSCTESEFRCDNQKCIPGVWICNQEDNCGDGSDEVSCAAYTCQPGYFECSSGHCVSDTLVCDSGRDCLDASDEANCDPRFPDGKYCPPNIQFECNNHVCVDPRFRCDGRDDCGDGSDETPGVCITIDCNEPFFRCNQTLLCLYGSKFCDGYDDCGDGSDEDAELCNPTVQEPVCLPGEYKCRNGKCIDVLQQCDDVDDCGDESDEIGCHKGENDLTCANKPCEQVCSEIPSSPNITGFYLCSCLPGYEVDREFTHFCLDIDECKQWDTCQQICRNLKGTYTCECYDGFDRVDSKCSSTGTVPVMLLPDEAMIRTYDLTNKYQGQLIDKQLRTQAVDFMFLNNDTSIVYWTDTAASGVSGRAGDVKPQIYRTLMPVIDGATNNMGSAQSLEIGVLNEPNGIAADWLTQNIYWTDTHRGAISVALLDGRYPKTVVKTEAPYAIALHPQHGHMYWTSIGSNPGLYRAHMDGEDQRKFDEVPIDYATGLAIDYQNDGRIYVADEKANWIFSVNRHGTDFQVVARGGIGSPISIDVFENTVYWTSLMDQTVYQKQKFGAGIHSALPLGAIRRPTSVKMLQRYKYDASLSPRCKSGVCSHLCLLRPFNSYTCACPDNSDFLPGSVTQCDAVSQAERQPPPVCACRNGATCVYSDSVPKCLCADGYSGGFCEHGGAYPVMSTGNVAAIVVPVVLVAILLVVGVVLVWRRNQSSSGGSVSDSKLACKGSCFSTCLTRVQGLFSRTNTEESFDNPNAVKFTKESENVFETDKSEEDKEDESRYTEIKEENLGMAGKSFANPTFGKKRVEGVPSSTELGVPEDGGSLGPGAYDLQSTRAGYKNPNYKNDKTALVKGDFNDSSNA